MQWVYHRKEIFAYPVRFSIPSALRCSIPKGGWKVNWKMGRPFHLLAGSSPHTLIHGIEKDIQKDVFLIHGCGDNVQPRCTPPLASLFSLSHFPLWLKPRKMGSTFHLLAGSSPHTLIHGIEKDIQKDVFLIHGCGDNVQPCCTPPLASLISLSHFPLWLKPRKMGSTFHLLAGPSPPHL
ncbi:hypothetical protein M2140_000313 [Clostridiales Family XIII bacterium PM5-7]